MSPLTSSPPVPGAFADAGFHSLARVPSTLTMAMHLMAIAAATGYQMAQPAAGLPARGRVPALRAVATAPTIEPALSPPTNKKEMLAQAAEP